MKSNSASRNQSAKSSCEAAREVAAEWAWKHLGKTPSVRLTCVAIGSSIIHFTAWLIAKCYIMPRIGIKAQSLFQLHDNEQRPPRAGGKRADSICLENESHSKWLKANANVFGSAFSSSMLCRGKSATSRKCHPWYLCTDFCQLVLQNVSGERRCQGCFWFFFLPNFFSVLHAREGRRLSRLSFHAFSPKMSRSLLQGITRGRWNQQVAFWLASLSFFLCLSGRVDNNFTPSCRFSFSISIFITIGDNNNERRGRSVSERVLSAAVPKRRPERRESATRWSVPNSHRQRFPPPKRLSSAGENYYFSNAALARLLAPPASSGVKENSAFIVWV